MASLPYLRRLAVALPVATFILAGCGTARPEGGPVGSSQQSTARSGRTLVMAVRTEGVTAAAKGLQTTGVRGAPVAMFNAGLAYTDQQDVPRPELAEALPQLDTNTWRLFPDGRMETTYRLKGDLVWQDGAPLSADDFVFALRVYQDPRYGSSNPTPQNLIAGITVPDARTIVIHWTQPYAEAGELRPGGLQALPRHILAEPLEQLDHDAFAAHPFWTTAYVGLGPYRIEQWDPGIGLEAGAFDRYARGRPNIDRIRVTYISDPNTVLANLLAGAVDVAISNALPPNQALVLRRQWGERGITLINPRDSSRVSEFQLHPERVPAGFAGSLDVRVRRAIAHAVDKQAINEAVFEGQGVLADTRILPNVDFFPAVDRVTRKYPFDLRRSEQLMNEAGYFKGSDGIHLSPTGTRLAGEDWIAANPQSELTQAIMLDTWKRAGFDIVPHFISQVEQRDARIRAERPGLYTGDGGSMETLGSDSIPKPENRWTGSNRGSYSNPEYDRLLAAWNTTLDRAERNSHMTEMARIYSEDLPSIPIHYNLGITAHAARLQGPINEALDIHLWEWMRAA